MNDLPKKVCNRKHRRRIQGKIIWKHEEILHSVKIFYPFWDFSFFSIRFEIAESKRVFFQTYQYQRATRCKRSNFRMRKLEVLIRQMILFFLGPPLIDNKKLIWLPLLLWSLFSLDSNFNGDLLTQKWVDNESKAKWLFLRAFHLETKKRLNILFIPLQNSKEAKHLSSGEKARAKSCW